MIDYKTLKFMTLKREYKHVITDSKIYKQDKRKEWLKIYAASTFSNILNGRTSMDKNQKELLEKIYEIKLTDDMFNIRYGKLSDWNGHKNRYDMEMFEKLDNDLDLTLQKFDITSCANEIKREVVIECYINLNTAKMFAKCYTTKEQIRKYYMHKFR